MPHEISTFKQKHENSALNSVNGSSGENTINGAIHDGNNGYSKKRKEDKGSKKVKREKSHKMTKREISSGVHRDQNEVDEIFRKLAQLINPTAKPIPNQAGGDAYIEKKPLNGILADLKIMRRKEFKTLKDVIKKKYRSELTDDKTYLMERVIQLVSGLPELSKARTELTNAFLGGLWDSLQHPPVSYLGEQYRYRQADGSCNNIMFPHLGAANTPYARSVQPKTINHGALPDPGLTFDALFARDKFTEHPNKVSSILFYWASIVVHDLFQTDHHDMDISKTSSYLDLSPLYGNVQADQDKIRTFKDGKIKPDCFSEHRMLTFPPGCGVILIMFNRFHNYVVEQLALINEQGRFTKPSNSLTEEAATKAWAKYDNDLFQTGRLITCGLYINITLLDYLRTIVNLNRSNSTWTLDPRVDMNKKYGKDRTPRGIGNQVAAEFNMVYRWHSATSQRDEKWTENMFEQMLGKPAGDVSMHDLLKGLGKFAEDLDEDPLRRPFAGLERNNDGTFDDDDLVSILADSVEDCAGSFGANNVPRALRAVEILGIMQGRKWGLATLNEFRKFFGLKQHYTFESINSDPIVAESLRNLYGHPDFVELYPGIVSEEAKVPMVPGVGIAPTYTISRAILSDAVCLVRGDRFYTVDYHAKNLTNWGFNEVQYDLNIEQGCVFYKLFLRSFPNHFKPDSIYAHHPMTIPSENRNIMRDLGREAHYSYDRPAFISPRIRVNSYLGAESVFKNQNAFKVTWDAVLQNLSKRGGLTLRSVDGRAYSQQKKSMSNAFRRENWQQGVRSFYEDVTLKLLHEKYFKIAGINHVDITRDVGNLAQVHFAANAFALPLKTQFYSKGAFDEYELFAALAVIFTYAYFDVDPVQSFPMSFAAQNLTIILGKLIELNVKSISRTGIIASVVDAVKKKDNYITDYASHIVKALVDAELSLEEATWAHLLPCAITMVPNQALAFTQAVDFYLSTQGVRHLPDIKHLAQLNTPEADETLIRYALEGVRLNSSFGSNHECSATITITNNDVTTSKTSYATYVGPNTNKTVNLQPGQKVFVSFAEAAKDPSAFPNPEEVRLDRPIDKYTFFGNAVHSCLGQEVNRVALGAMFKVVCRLENLRRAKGPKGILKKSQHPGGYEAYLKEDYGSFFPFPLTMQVNWDGPLPSLDKSH